MKTLQEIANEIDVWEGWRDHYGDFVPVFIEEAKKGNNWKDWNQDIFFEYFEKSGDQCVSSLKLGYFTVEEQEKIKGNWLEIAPLLQKIAYSQNEPLFEVYHELKNIIRKYTKQNRMASTNRLIAGIQPNLLCTIVNEGKLKVFIKKLNGSIENCNIPITADWFSNSNAVWSFFLENLDSDLPYENMTLPWQIYELLMHDLNNTNDMSEISAYSSTIIDLLQYKKQIILQGPPGTGKTREAKLIAKEILGFSSVKGLENSEQFKLVQFHPGYMYDDFVRGIVVKHDEEKEEIIYEAENKVLGKFAESANKNYIRSRVDNTISSAKSDFQRFKDYVILKLDESPENKFFISKNVYIFHVDDYRFKYKGDNWTTHSHGLNMNFSELEKIIKYGFKERIEINKSSSLNSLTRSHATYFANVLDQYNSFLKSESENSYEPLNNYVLIIDEINRANLSSVLGELIYALEYRGDIVESMYEVGGSRELILPSNLYIIGTMNTADRSVGHIDYAIRRRFAFVDVLPKNLKIEDGLENFDETLFLQIKSLFTKDEYQTNSDYLADEFKPVQVALGHSYFIDKTEDGGSMDIRLEYEIKPILREYVKDGILKPSALEIIENLGK
ncbi:AAA family ATPase [uncultured Chryseobacterium sp.]|uniref:AAA family ATPase n=1 Tax=uncultured Chryseobacterium sp. TaxID=259322 RepID=UPI0025F40A9E|nr:AAA family ATPase [uncultured Chryseobacterium sp.]